MRKKVEYGDLLRQIRQNKVRLIAYFDNNTAPPENAAPSTQTNLELEGYCLVVYNDDTVAQVSCASPLHCFPHLPSKLVAIASKILQYACLCSWPDPQTSAERSLVLYIMSTPGLFRSKNERK